MATPITTQGENEAEDFLSDALEGLYGYIPISHSSAGSRFCYTLSEEQLHMQASLPGGTTSSPSISLLTPTTESKNWSLHATSIWNSSLFLANHLHELDIDHHVRAVQTRGQSHLRVLELGAGAGLPSILLSRCYDAVDVFASDYPDDELIRSLEANVKMNGVEGKCRTVPYAWGSGPTVFKQCGLDLGSSGEEGVLDVIIAADTLWNSQSHQSLLSSLQFLLRRTADARVYMVAGLHTGRYTLQAFVQLVEESELECEELVERNLLQELRREWKVDRVEGEDVEKERRQWAVWMKIKWREDILRTQK